MPRFFVDFPFAEGKQIWLTGEDGRHVSRSLRMRPGEQLTLCDSKGTDCLCTVMQTEGDSVLLKMEQCGSGKTEPAVEVTIYQCLPKGDKLETVVQKAVELGAVAIVPVESMRCVVKLDRKTAEKKTARLQKIALEAAKQSGRGKVPAVESPMPLKAALQQAVQAGDALFCYEGGGIPLSKLLPETGGSIGVFIGPEGGFDPAEVRLAQETGASAVTLGPRILRTETVALAMLSVILYEKGELE